MITECNHDADLKICFACQEKNSVKRLTEERNAAIREIGPAHREAERLRAEVERLTQERDTIIEQCAEACESLDLYGLTVDQCAAQCAAAVRAMKGGK
jgi:phage host-nuclease inhibitor protein Gam